MRSLKSTYRISTPSKLTPPDSTRISTTTSDVLEVSVPVIFSHPEPFFCDRTLVFRSDTFSRLIEPDPWHFSTALFKIARLTWPGTFYCLSFDHDRRIFQTICSYAAAPKLRSDHCVQMMSVFIHISAVKRSIRFSQSRRRPLLGPSPGWKHLLALSH